MQQMETSVLPTRETTGQKETDFSLSPLERIPQQITKAK